MAKDNIGGRTPVASTGNGKSDIPTDVDDAQDKRIRRLEADAEVRRKVISVVLWTIPVIIGTVGTCSGVCQLIVALLESLRDG